jgi:hypothetical protein
LIVTWMFWVSEQDEPWLLHAAPAATVTTTGPPNVGAYELLVGVKVAIMLSLPTGRVVVMHWADEGGLIATAVHPVIGVVPLRNSTVPAGLVLSAAETVEVKVTDAPKATLVALADSVVVVPVCGGVS